MAKGMIGWLGNVLDFTFGSGNCSRVWQQMEVRNQWSSKAFSRCVSFAVTSLSRLADYGKTDTTRVSYFAVNHLSHCLSAVRSVQSSNIRANIHTSWIATSLSFQFYLLLSQNTYIPHKKKISLTNLITRYAPAVWRKCVTLCGLINCNHSAPLIAYKSKHKLQLFGSFDHKSKWKT